MSDSTFATFMYFNSMAVFITALLPLRYPNQSPFLTVPKTMIVLVLSTVVYYLFHVGILLSPGSRFATMAKHLTPFFAYAAVSSLVAALFPDRRATAFIYTIFSLLLAGHALFKLGVFAVEDEDRDNKDEVQAEQTWYEGFATGFRRYINKLARGVAGFFQEQTTQPDGESA